MADAVTGEVSGNNGGKGSGMRMIAGALLLPFTAEHADAATVLSK